MSQRHCNIRADISNNISPNIGNNISNNISNDCPSTSNTAGNASSINATDIINTDANIANAGNAGNFGNGNNNIVQKFFTIGEVATKLNISPAQIRNWEKRTSLIKPSRRAGGRRYYSLQDIRTLTKMQLMISQKGLTLQQTIQVVENICDDGKEKSDVGTGSASSDGSASLEVSLFNIQDLDKKNYEKLKLDRGMLSKIYDSLNAIKEDIENNI